MSSKAGFKIDMNAVLGNGSFGIVYKAKDKRMKAVAAKRIDFKATSKKQLPEIASDLKKLTRLHHENVAQIFEVWPEEGTLWVFMELCNHGDLVDYLQGDEAASSISDNEKLKLMLDIAKGVEYLHSNNVIHRDIKPKNILVSNSPATAKLTDFDCSKFLNEDYSTSRMSSNVGTQAFKAPEFYFRTDEHKLEYHRNVDIYAMGLTFLAMIQNHPFLIPKLETPNEPSELGPGYTIGMLMAERKRYEDEPLEVVKIPEEGSDPEQQLWNDVRVEILKMTHVDPRARASAAEVVQNLVEFQPGNKKTEKVLRSTKAKPRKRAAAAAEKAAESVGKLEIRARAEVVDLKHVATHETDLIPDKTKLTLMSDGLLVFRGKIKWQPLSFHCYRTTESGISLHKTLPPTCSHLNKTEMLRVKLGDKELLAVSCSACRDIKCLDLETGKAFKALGIGSGSQVPAGQVPEELCHGEAGEMFVGNRRGTIKFKGILRLDCSAEIFSLIQVVPVQAKCFTYIPVHRLLAIGEDSRAGEIKLVSVSTSETVWVSQACPHPTSLVYSPGLDLLFASGAGGIVALGRADGSVREVCPQEIRDVQVMCIHGDQVMAQCGVGGASNKVKVAVFKLPC